MNWLLPINEDSGTVRRVTMRRKRSTLVAIRIPEGLHQRILRKMQATGLTKTEVMVRAIQDGI